MSKHDGVLEIHMLEIDFEWLKQVKIIVYQELDSNPKKVIYQA